MKGTSSAAPAIDKPMVQVSTLQEFFSFNDWACDKVMSCAAGLNEEQLDRPFEMGEGSLWKTLNHIFAAECVWLDRWEKHPRPRYPINAEGVTMTHLWSEFKALALRRDRFIAAQESAQLTGPLTYTNRRGETNTFPVGMMMLHVCVHGSHHRAQAVNMLRRAGAELPKPGADYIFMKIEQPHGTPCILDVDTLRTCFRYSDWAQRRVLSIAHDLTDDQLSQSFDIGLGTIRKTIAHIRDAEGWWLTNWTKGPGAPFPKVDAAALVGEVCKSFEKIAAERNQILHAMKSADLQSPVSAKPRPDRTITFPIGVTMLQLCHHGAHHRAQLLNMLRHVGAPLPELDVLAMLKS